MCLNAAHYEPKGQSIIFGSIVGRGCQSGAQNKTPQSTLRPTWGAPWKGVSTFRGLCQGFHFVGSVAQRTLFLEVALYL